MGVKKGIYPSLEMMEERMRDEGFDDLKTYLELLIIDDWSTHQISDLFDCTYATIYNWVKRLGLQSSLNGRGGFHSRRCADEKWRMRARVLGFDNEVEMLKKYRLHYKDLVEKLNSFCKNEFVISRECVKERYRRRGVLPAICNIKRPDKILTKKK